MRSSVRRLLRFRRHRYLSQAGEAGILEEVFRRLGITRGVILEAGASDGLFLSNTNQFVGKGHKLIYVESNPDEFQKLRQNFQHHDDVTTLLRHITPAGPDSLDVIASELGLPGDVDLLVVDIDSYDIAVLRGLESLRPKVVMIEYNPFFLPSEEYEADSGDIHPSRGGKGSSLGTLYRVAAEKGYQIVCTLNMNAIFVRAELLPRIHDQPVTLDESATFEFLPIRDLAPWQILQRAYYLGLSRVLRSLAIRVGLVPTFQYKSRNISPLLFCCLQFMTPVLVAYAKIYVIGIC